MLEYSPDSVESYAFLYEPFNDIDIYVEDTTNRATYEILFERLLEGKGKITRLFEAGGRSGVLDKVAAHTGDRPTLYLIDGDLDYFTGQVIPEHDNLYRLKAYCSENIILCNDAIDEVAFEIACTKPKSEVSAEIEIEEYLNRCCERILPLYFYYGIVRKHSLQSVTINYHLSRLTEDNSDEISVDKVAQRITELEGEILEKISQEEFDESKREMEENYAQNGIPPRFLISGKDHLLWLVSKRLKTKYKYNEGDQKLCPRLARHCCLELDIGLKNKIEQLVA